MFNIHITPFLLPKLLAACCLFLYATTGIAQLTWINVDTAYAPLPGSVHVYTTTTALDNKPFVAYYAIADLRDRQLNITVDTSQNRRLTPRQFFEKNNHPLLVVNTSFFSFETNQNLNLVIKAGKLLSYNIHSIPGKNKDTLTYNHVLGSAIGFRKNRRADIAWVWTATAKRHAYATQFPWSPVRDSVPRFSIHKLQRVSKSTKPRKGVNAFKKWKVQAAVGGGPVLVQDGLVQITHKQEQRFTGKGQSDKHPRTLIGYTRQNELIVMVIQGRAPGIAEGATLPQCAALMVELGCIEAMNLDGGGSSCLLINGKPTIPVSDKSGQRPIPAVLLVSTNQ